MHKIAFKSVSNGRCNFLNLFIATTKLHIEQAMLRPNDDVDAIIDFHRGTGLALQVLFKSVNDYIANETDKRTKQHG